jgi:hypothetical protein
MKILCLFAITILFFTFVHSAQVELLVNNGFEDGVLTPWTTNNWIIDTSDPHSGTYHAYNEGNYWIKQEFTPTDVNDIISITFWYKQPEEAIFAFDLYYGSTDYDEDIFFVDDPDWVEYDITSYLRSSGNLEAIRIWGYAGGGPDPDACYLDDVSIIYEDHSTIINTSIGSIKALFE